MTTAVEVVAGRPGATIVSYSELDTGRQCPHKHQLSYKERWTQPKDETTAAGRGTLWHKVMDAHYTALKVGENPRFAVEQRMQDFRDAGKNVDTIDLLMWMYEGYTEKWGLDGDWEVLVVEYKTVVPLRYAPTKTGRPGRMSKFDLKMIIDLVVRDRSTGRIWIIDHKSHANLPKQRELELDDQFGLYTWGLRQLGHKIFGCIYNTARTTRNKGDFQENLDEWHRKKAAGEKAGAVPKQQTLDERYDRYLMNRTVPETDAAAQDALSTALNLYSKANRGERHTNSDTCRWKCDYTEACLLGRKTGDDRERVFLGDIGFKQDFTRH